MITIHPRFYNWIRMCVYIYNASSLEQILKCLIFNGTRSYTINVLYNIRLCSTVEYNHDRLRSSMWWQWPGLVVRLIANILSVKTNCCKVNGVPLVKYVFYIKLNCTYLWPRKKTTIIMKRNDKIYFNILLIIRHIYA